MRQLNNLSFGGLKLNNDSFRWLQLGTREAILGLAKTLSPYNTYSLPVAIEGCTIVDNGSTIDVGEGWVLWQPSGGVLDLFYVPATTGIAASAEDSVSLKVTTVYGGSFEGRTYSDSQITEQATPGTSELYEHKYLQPVVGNSPGGVFFVLDTMLYGGAAIGEQKFIKRSSAEMVALGFDMGTGKGSGKYNGWQVDLTNTGRALIAAGSGYVSGTTYGTLTETLSQAQLATHSHGIIEIIGETHPSYDPSRRFQINSTDANKISFIRQADGGSTDSIGSGSTHNNLGPSLASYLIEKVR